MPLIYFSPHNYNTAALSLGTRLANEFVRPRSTSLGNVLSVIIPKTARQFNLGPVSLVIANIAPAVRGISITNQSLSSSLPVLFADKLHRNTSAISLPIISRSALPAVVKDVSRMLLNKTLSLTVADLRPITTRRTIPGKLASPISITVLAKTVVTSDNNYYSNFGAQ